MYDKEYALKSRDNKEKFRNNLKVGLLIFFWSNEKYFVCRPTGT